jgi:hypothetical protein
MFLKKERRKKMIRKQPLLKCCANCKMLDSDSDVMFCRKTLDLIEDITDICDEFEANEVGVETKLW